MLYLSHRVKGQMGTDALELVVAHQAQVGQDTVRAQVGRDQEDQDQEEVLAAVEATVTNGTR